MDAAPRGALFDSFAPEARAALATFFEPVELSAGEFAVREGDRDRDMYVIAEGEALVERGGVEVDRLGSGHHFGELSLIAARPRAASVRAETQLSLLRLSPASLRRLTLERPALVVPLLEVLVSTLGQELSSMTDGVRVLLRDRSLPRRRHVRATVAGVVEEVWVGTPVGEVLPEMVDGHPTVAALLGERPVSMTTPLSSDASVKPLTTAHWEGRRIYQRSLALLLLEAAGELGLEVRLDYSVGLGQRVHVEAEDRPRVARELEARMQAIASEDRPLRDELWTLDEARAHLDEAGDGAGVDLLRTWRQPAIPLGSYGRVYAPAPGPLLPSTGSLTGFRVVVDDGALLLVYGPHGSQATPSPEATSPRHSRPPPPPLLDEALRASSHARKMTKEPQRWLSSLGTSTVGELNRACIDGDVSELIRVAEGFQEKRISRIADAIRLAGARVVCIAGPSSSGKTTFIKRLSVQLRVDGLRPHGISLDDYYVDRDKNPRDERGEYDFEAFEALRVELLGDHLTRLLRGESVHTARYDFQTGASFPAGGPELSLGEGGILLLEGLHGLNPRLLAGVAPEGIFRIFICPLAQLPLDRLQRVHASDVRLLRRIVRDRHGRGTASADNIARWPAVRRGEQKHIFPFQQHADAVFDSSLIYELSVLRVYAERYLLEVPQDHPSYTTAFRLLGLLERFVSIYPDHVPPTSLLREFIGGSGFEY
ncbi:MAG: cyclic nucleotide-binding domain-containing protein [Deltaproteobacteria bacterium]|nr:cyclic nucleotide-binding domain-containing protein [Deltaproteobacteria bacterium]